MTNTIIKAIENLQTLIADIKSNFGLTKSDKDQLDIIQLPEGFESGANTHIRGVHLQPGFEEACAD